MTGKTSGMIGVTFSRSAVTNKVWRAIVPCGTRIGVLSRVDVSPSPSYELPADVEEPGGLGYVLSRYTAMLILSLMVVFVFGS